MFNVVEDIFKKLFEVIWDWIIAPFTGIKAFDDLIFGGNGELAYGVFTLEELEKIYVPGMNISVALAVTAMLIGIVFAGMKISSSGINPSNRTYVIEFFKDLVIVGLIFFNLSTLYQLIFGVNYIIVDAFNDPDTMINNMFDIGGVFERFSSSGVLGAIIIGLIMLGLGIWANWYYMIRKLTLLILMIFGPLMLALYLIPQTRQITSAWFKELVGTVFVQSIHAALYWITSAISLGTTGIETIILYAVFIPVSESLRSLLGLGGNMANNMSKAGAMMGLAGLAGVGGAIKGALNGKSVMETLKGGYQAYKDRKSNTKGAEESDGKSGVLTNASTDSSTTSRAEKMLKAGQIFSKGGKAVFGAAGAIAGMPLGPMGSIALSTVGYSTGGVAGAVAGRGIAATGQLAKDRIGKGSKRGKNTFQGLKNAENNADESIANEIAEDETNKWASVNEQEFKDDFQKRFPDATTDSVNQAWGEKLANVKADNLEKARATVGQIKQESKNMAKANELVNTTTDQLTKDWAKSNKEAFMKDYDAKNPPPEDYIDQIEHEAVKKKTWEHQVAQKREEIHKAVSSSASSLTNGSDLENAYLDKGEFTNKVGSDVGSIIGKEGRTAKNAVKNATDSVKNVSLYSGKSVNTDFLANRLASVKTEQAKQKFVADYQAHGFADEKGALEHWNKNVYPQEFKNNLQNASKSLPENMKLPNRILSNKPLVQGAAAIGGAAVSTFLGTTGISSIPKVGSTISNSRIGQSAKAFGMGLQNPTDENGQLSDSKGISFSSGIKSSINAWKSYVPENAVKKQANFRNAVAYTTGLIGGVSGYQFGSKIASGGQNWKNQDGSFDFKWNPYNNAVNQQMPEISQIEQMVQTIGTGNEAVVAQGALRMVQTREGTVLQVRNKAGQVQTVSRIGSGDVTLPKGQAVYQDLSIQNGQMVTNSSVYREDSAGGRIGLNRTINVNPNRLIANRNTPKTPRVVTNVQSYNQAVDSGQFTMKDAIQEVSNIRMVIERDRSYMLGTKNGSEYRISQYGRGDTRLESGQVVYRTCEVRNNKVVANKPYNLNTSGEPIETTHYTSITPDELLPKYPPNSRNRQRKQVDQQRVKAFTEPLR